MRRRIRTGLVTGLSLAVSAGAFVASSPVAEAKPTFTVSTVVSGLAVPWDLTWVGDLMLFDQRAGSLYSKRGTAAPKKVQIPLPSIYASSEGGLLGIVADPSAASTQRFYTCQSVSLGGGQHDVRVMPWRLTSDTSAVAAGDPLITGIPSTSGRHNGCRLRFGPGGKLFVGTGDAAVTGTSQDRSSLGGKVLRVDPTGSIPTDNPFYGEGGNARYVWSYGHRNVQGLALRPGTSEMWSAEHGSYRDDEVNLSVRGGNYGWQAKPGYDESPPMTDLQKYPDAVRAKWSSGDPTVATSGITFLNGSGWGRWQGSLAVAYLKGQGITIMYLEPTSKITKTEKIAETTKYGRIRTVEVGPDGSLYFTTSNGSGDIIGKITPTATPPVVAAGSDVSSSAVSAVRTGNDLYAFIRTTGDQIQFKRSTDDGHTWPSAWTSTGVTSTAAPSVASSATGRVDLVVRGSNGRIGHVWFVNGVKAGTSDLGGDTRSATVSSLGDGTLDVLALGTTGKIYRKHGVGTTWAPRWEKLGGAYVSSRAGASADPATGRTLITARGLGGGTYERVRTATGSSPAWVKVPGSLWSARALGDRFPGRSLVAVSRGGDGYAKLSRDGLTMALELGVSGDPDVVTRPDGSWVVFARSSAGSLTYYDGRSGEYKMRSLGGTVR